MISIQKIHTYYISSYKVSTDTRNIEKNALFFALKGENFNANAFAKQAIEKGASYAIIDEKKYQVDDRFILVDDVLKTLQELAKFHRKYLGIPIIALTGSNGKTTTKELINTVLSEKYITTATKGNLNNHIGVPLTLLSMTRKTEIGIVEMGANHPKEIAFLCKITKPNFGYITNFGKAHLEGFGNLKGVIKAKTELYKYLKKKGKKVFVNTNDKIQVKKAKGIDTITFGSKNAVIIIKNNGADPFVKVTYNDKLIVSNLIGAYNFNNIAAAIAIGNYFKVDGSNIKSAIENYNPTNNRSQIILKGSNKIILDAYNANPSSMQCAIENFIQLSDTNKIAILGDMFELGEHAKKEHQFVADLLKTANIAAVYLLGENFIKVKTQSTSISTYQSFDNFKTYFEKNNIKNTTFLIKASRGMALERLLEFIN